MKFCYPRLSKFDFFFIRSPGPGLGNLLFPVCRAYLASLDEGSAFIEPTWRQLKIGPFLRGEVDSRTYDEISIKGDLSQRARDYVRAFGLTKFDENDPRASEDNVDRCVVFHGCKNYFHDLIEHRQGISNWLGSWKSVRSVDKNKFRLLLHVRLADFTPCKENIDTGTCYRSSMVWYREIGNEIINRERIRPEEILVLTDGKLSEVRNEIGIDAFYSNNLGGLNALELMLVGAQSEFLIGSRSTFSMWMHFLGNGVAYFERSFSMEPYFPFVNQNNIFFVE